MSTIGSKIREYRKLNNLSFDKLAAITGLTSGYIGRIERGEKNYSNPTIETLRKIAKALNCSVADLISEQPAA